MRTIRLRLKRQIPILFLGIFLFPQTAISADVLSRVKLIANNVLKNTTYLYYDKSTGVFINDLTKYGYTKDIVAQNGYNEWKYWTGVTHIGFNELGEVTKDPIYQTYAKKNFEFFFKDIKYLKSIYTNDNQWNFPVAQGINITQLDDCGAMGASLIEVYNKEKKDEYKAYIDATADYIMNKQIRFTDGAFCRPRPNKNTLWADDLYMSVPFLARMGKLTGNKKYFDEATKQVILFNNYLFDEKTGLMFHCYYSDLNTQGGSYWGRCNGWIMMATSDLLRFLPENHPQRDKIISLLNRQIRNIAQYQSENGLWHQLLNKETSYLETSCSAMFTYSIALAINNGWVDERYKSIALSGWDGINTQITSDGSITNVCMGTGIGNDIKFYYDRPTPYNDLHGLGAVILAGLEVYKLSKL